MMNSNKVIDREEFKRSLETSSMVSDVLRFFGTIMQPRGTPNATANGPKGRTMIFLDVVQTMRSSLARAEEGFVRRLLMLQGGVDEEHFLAVAVPMMVDRLEQHLGMDQIVSLIETVGDFLAGTNDQADLLVQVAHKVALNSEAQPLVARAIVVAQAKAVDCARDFCKALFHLCDIDCTGKITTREIEILKAFLDCFLRLGNVANDSQTAWNVAEELLLALFDMIDQRCDNQLHPEELVHFVVRIATFLVSLIDIVSSAVTAALEEVGTQAVATLLIHAQFQTVRKHQIPEVMEAIFDLAVDGILDD